MKEKCGCTEGTGVNWVNDADCLLPEAVGLIIKLMNRVKYWEAGLGGDELHSEAEAFLAKVAE